MNQNKIIEQLEQHRTAAPDGFADRVMAKITIAPKQTFGERLVALWPSHGAWIAPAFAGAAAVFLIMLGVGHFNRPASAGQVAFHFELHAPGADRVELLGTFNNWKTGDIVLSGPDASGHFTAAVELPQGRHEYIFLVDGERWEADPKGVTHRPDGFGRVNTVIKVYEDENA